MINVFKKFELYTPEHIPEEFVGHNIIFCRSSCGMDWYELRDKLSKDSTKILFNPETGTIGWHGKDVSKVFANKMSFLETKNVPVGFPTEDGADATDWMVDDKGDIVPNMPVIQRKFDREVSLRMNPITNRINFITEAMEDGDATPEEISELASLKQRRSVLRRITPEMVESDGWPE